MRAFHVKRSSAAPYFLRGCQQKLSLWEDAQYGESSRIIREERPSCRESTKSFDWGFLELCDASTRCIPCFLDRNSKKKLSDQVASDGLVIDPLSDLAIDVESFDIKHEAYVYFDSSGRRCWTKAWFNGREKGEKAIEITRMLAIKFINDEISQNDWLTRFYPKQMSVYHKAIEQARQQLLSF